jgi:hypothetical protein
MSTATRRPARDTVCIAAVDIALAAAQEAFGADDVGNHLGVDVEGERLVTHYFACTSSAYVGWRWAVTVTRIARSRIVTVDELVLLPGVGALLAPAWVPWSERLRPGDLGVGDILPTASDDWRLAPGMTDTGPDADRQMVWELGLGRPRVLSPEGRDDTVDRWYGGEQGPTAAMAEAAPAPCSTCGFFVPLAGELRRVFGVCANVYAPADGRVVAVDHGCGAHSEASVTLVTG